MSKYLVFILVGGHQHQEAVANGDYQHQGLVERNVLSVYAEAKLLWVPKLEPEGPHLRTELLTCSKNRMLGRIKYRIFVSKAAFILINFSDNPYETIEQQPIRSEHSRF